MADDTPRGGKPFDLSEGYARWKAENPEAPNPSPEYIRASDLREEMLRQSRMDDHIQDAMRYGMGASFKGERVKPEEFNRKPTMESVVLRRYLREWQIDLHDNFVDDTIEAFDAITHKELCRFSKAYIRKHYAIAEEVNAYVYESLRAVIEEPSNKAAREAKQRKTAEEVRMREEELRARSERIQAEMSERLRKAQEKIWEDLRSNGGYGRAYYDRAGERTQGFDRGYDAFAEFRRTGRYEDSPFNPNRGRPSSGQRTPEQRAALDKARKVKRLMDAADNDGIRANAKASLDKILSKHGLSLADL